MLAPGPHQELPGKVSAAVVISQAGAVGAVPLAQLLAATRNARGLRPKAWGIHSLGELLILVFRTEHQPYDTVEAFYSMKPRQWLFTIFLFASYIAIFHVWGYLTGQWILATGLVASAILGGTLLAVGRNYFVNLWDRLFHGAVILDLLIEAFFEHHFGFYWCALGFAVLIVGYRLLIHRSRCASVDATDLD